MKRREGRRREKARFDRRGKTTEQRWAEKNAGEHLTDDGVLSEPAEERSYDAAGGHNHEQLKEKNGQ